MKFLGVIIDEYLLYISAVIFKFAVSRSLPLSFLESKRKEPEIKSEIQWLFQFRVNSQQTMLSWFFFLWQKSEAVIRDLEEMVSHESQYENPLVNLVMPQFEGQVVDAHGLESSADQLVWLNSDYVCRLYHWL